jgi:hypothetical protein
MHSDLSASPDENQGNRIHKAAPEYISLHGAKILKGERAVA